MNISLRNRTGWKKIALCGIILLGLFGIGWGVISSRQEAEIRAMAQRYWQFVMQKDYDAAMDMLYFKPENSKIRAYTEKYFPFEIIYSYDIKEIKKYSSDLYEIPVDFISNYTEGEEDPVVSVYHYVAKIDGEWKYLLGDEEIPDDMCPFPRTEVAVYT